MIQFNLLPDVKLDYIKTRHTKRLVVLASIFAAGLSLVTLIIMFLSVQVGQKHHLKNLSKDITKEETTLTSTPDIDKILTIQNQIKNLPQLHEQKPIASRLFKYIQQVTPVNANISKLEMDFSVNTMIIQGSSTDLAIANKFADTLKFATYKTSTTTDGKPFTSIVTALTRDERTSNFTISFNFDPVLFSNAEEPTLTVPKIVSTRSETEKPESVFKASIPTDKGGSQ